MNLPINKKNREEILNAQARNLQVVDDISEIKNVPNVVFKDLELQVEVGQWMEVLDSGICSSLSKGVKFISHLSAEALLRYGISKSELENVTQAFGNLLWQVGVPVDETCVLNVYDKDNIKFNCHFKEKNEDASISLIYGNMDFMPSMVVEYNNIRRVYEYSCAHDGKPRKLDLDYFVAKNKDNGNEVYSYMSSDNANFKISNGNKSLNIEVKRPNGIRKAFGFVFRLKNDAEFVKYLLNLNFPIALDDVYKKLCELCLDSVDNYPRVKLKALEKINDEKKRKDEEMVTDHIQVEDGCLKTFILTRKGKKVGIDSKGNTVYQEENFSVDRNKLGVIDYHLTIDASADMENIGSFRDHVKIADEGIEEIRKLAKVVSGKDI